MFGTKSVCLTFSIFLFVVFGEMYVPFLDSSFIYGYFEFGGMVALVGWKRTKSRLRRKKTAPDAKNGASCVSRGDGCGCGSSGREVLYNNSKIILFRFFIPKKYTNFATACVWEEAKAAGQRLHCRGPDEEEFFRSFPLHTLDYKRFTNK